MANPSDSPRDPEQVGSLPDLYDAIAPHALQALWSVSLLYPEPRTDVRPWILTSKRPLARVAGATSVPPLRTLDTVDTETPACAAIALSVLLSGIGCSLFEKLSRRFSIDVTS